MSYDSEVGLASHGVLVVLAGCGRLNFEARSDGAIVADAQLADVGDGATACSRTAPWSAPVPVPGLNTAAYDSSVVLTSDELTAYFYSNRTGNEELFVGTRSRVDEAFAVAELVSLSTVDDEAHPTLSRDGTILVFHSTRPPSDPQGDLWFATAAANTFSGATRIADLASLAVDYHPLFQLGTDNLYFSSNRTGRFAIYHTVHLGSGSFTPAVELTELDPGMGNHGSATVSGDGRVIYFRSDRPGGLGGYDIWRAERTSTSDPFGPASPVVELNSAATDTPTWLSADECRLYLTSTRDGSADLFVAAR